MCFVAFVFFIKSEHRNAGRVGGGEILDWPAAALFSCGDARTGTAAPPASTFHGALCVFHSYVIPFRGADKEAMKFASKRTAPSLLSFLSLSIFLSFAFSLSVLLRSLIKS